MARRYDQYDWKDTDPTGQPIPPRRNVSSAITSTAGGSLNQRMTSGLADFIGKSVISRLAFPGTMAQTLTKFSWMLPERWQLPSLEKKAAWLMNRMRAKRFRLKTRTGNVIDSMIVDHRENPNLPRGNVLVVTCEGNYSFYEAGVSDTPLRLGYSVLMWNHPGYGASSGYPSPAEEAAAIDVVIQFAIFGRGWSESDIVVYGWSIGGYAASWAAMNYPNIRGIILDATFDDLLLVAQKWIPRSCHWLMVRAIRTHWNLDIGQQLVRYKGPILLVRRSNDQIMSTEASNVTAMRRTNRLNWLLKALMQDRYPGIFGEDDSLEPLLDEWLEGDEAARDSIYNSYEIAEDEWIVAAILEHVRNVATLNHHGIPADIFPMPIGYDYDSTSRRQIALFLISRYFSEADTDHDSLLDPEKFVLPSHPWEAMMSNEDVMSGIESVTVAPDNESENEK